MTTRLLRWATRKAVASFLRQASPVTLAVAGGLLVIRLLLKKPRPETATYRLAPGESLLISYRDGERPAS